MTDKRCSDPYPGLYKVNKKIVMCVEYDVLEGRVEDKIFERRQFLQTLHHVLLGAVQDPPWIKILIRYSYENIVIKPAQQFADGGLPLFLIIPVFINRMKVLVGPDKKLCNIERELGSQTGDQLGGFFVRNKTPMPRIDNNGHYFS
jgi:hypothetical protein